jgi:DNA-binding phage protein
MSAEQIRAALRDRNLKAVAEATGLSPGTLYRLVRGSKKPHRATLAVLEAYLTKDVTNG